MKATHETTTIMIVDDEPHNLDVLERMLREEGGYEVVAFPRGKMALAAAQDAPPDLILLDILMPGIDGYEVCRRLKADKSLAAIPVLFLSALTDPLDKVKAFELGALDYITKPLSEAEVLARVKTHLSLRRYQLDMEEQVRLRSEQLVEAHRRLKIWDEAKDQWLGVLAHEMRTPLTGIFGVSDYIFDELPGDSALQDFRPEYEAARERMQKLIDDSLLLTYIDVDSDTYRMSPVPLRVAIDEALAGLDGSPAVIEMQPGIEDIGEAAVIAEPSLLFRACADVLRTASLCVHPGECVSVDASLEGGRICLFIHTNGPSLSEESLNAFFDVGGQRTLVVGGGDFGLGPALAARIFELFNGSVSVMNGDRQGIMIALRLPLAELDADEAVAASHQQKAE